MEMEVSKAEQDQHDSLVRSMVKYCKDNQYVDIKADLPEYIAPPKLRNSIPDVLARNAMNNWLICEAETSNTINIDHTKGQMADFATFNATIIMLVPKDCEIAAKQALQSWELSEKVKVWTV